MPAATRLTADDIGCWVIKSRTAPEQILPGWARGTTRELTRCLRRSYRVELMRPGQPCLLWLSGREGAGVQAIGALTSAAELPPDPPDLREVAVTASFALLLEPVARISWLTDHELAGAEVVRMPAGSNPSFLGPERWDALRTHLSPHDLGRAGW